RSTAQSRCSSCLLRSRGEYSPYALTSRSLLFFFKQKTAYDIGLGIPAEPLFRSSSLMAVNIHITIIELNALHTKRQNLFQELDAVIHLLMEAKHWGLRKSRNATSLNSRFKSLD